MLHGSIINVYFMFSSIQYHYTINNDYTWYYICSAWFLVTRISSCCLVDLCNFSETCTSLDLELLAN